MSTSAYTQECRDRAVELLLQGHRSVAKDTRELGANVRLAGRTEVGQRYHLGRNRPGGLCRCDERIGRLTELSGGGVADFRLH